MLNLQSSRGSMTKDEEESLLRPTSSILPKVLVNQEEGEEATAVREEELGKRAAELGVSMGMWQLSQRGGNKDQQALPRTQASTALHRTAAVTGRLCAESNCGKCWPWGD